MPRKHQQWFTLQIVAGCVLPIVFVSYADADVSGSPKHEMFGCLCQYSAALQQEFVLANDVTC